MEILIINSGSSSLKYQLIDSETGKSQARGLVDRIGIDGSSVKYVALKNGEEVEVKKQLPIANHEEGLNIVAQLLCDAEVGVISNPDDIKGIGHRIVHGGEKLVEPTIINDEVEKIIEDLTPLAPLHNPGNLSGIRVARKLFPNATHCGVLDTAFHQTMPAKAYRYAIPAEYYEKHGIRAYGFHGISHKFVDGEARKALGKADAKNITIHIGNGASMSAVNSEGKCVDTSMGFTPLDGLVMGTRCGQIDAGVVFHLGSQLGLSNDEINTIFNKKSGMLGVSGYSDARDVTAKYNEGEENAILCYEMYAYRIKKFIGAYIAALNGVDSIIFTAGLGENDALVRKLVCKDLSVFGIELDEEKNEKFNHPKQPVEIQKDGVKVKIFVIPTNEELQIVNEIKHLVK